VAEDATAALHAIDFGLGTLSRSDLSLITEILHQVRIAAGDFVTE
jgi:hypothetical protein